MKTNYRCMRAMEKCAKVKQPQPQPEPEQPPLMTAAHTPATDCCNMLQQGYYVDRETI